MTNAFYIEITKYHAVDYQIKLLKYQKYKYVNNNNRS